MFKISHTIFYVLLISSCNSENVKTQEPELSESEKINKEETPEINREDWINYKIPAGAHDNGIKSFSLSANDSLNFWIKFDSTAFYTSAITENQHDWNKLIGFSDCGTHHLKNSLRVVWRWSPEKGLELGKYLYQDEKRSYENLQTIEINRPVEIAVSIKEGQYFIYVDDKQYQHPRHCDSRFLSYILYPYFGGDEPAPQEINHFMIQNFP